MGPRASAQALSHVTCFMCLAQRNSKAPLFVRRGSWFFVDRQSFPPFYEAYENPTRTGVVLTWITLRARFAFLSRKMTRIMRTLLSAHLSEGKLSSRKAAGPRRCHAWALEWTQSRARECLRLGVHRKRSNNISLRGKLMTDFTASLFPVDRPLGELFLGVLFGAWAVLGPQGNPTVSFKVRQVKGYPRAPE